jgi:hypothetical protein
MVDALGIARDLRANHARRVAVGLGPMHAPDAAPVDHLHIEGTDGGAIVRADGGAVFDAGSLVHGRRMMPERERKEKAA